MKKTIKEDGTVVFIILKEFKKFLWKSRLLMWGLSIDRPLTRKEKIKIFFFGRP